MLQLGQLQPAIYLIRGALIGVDLKGGVDQEELYRNPFLASAAHGVVFKQERKGFFFVHCSLNLFSRVDIPLPEPLPAAIVHLRAFLHFSLWGKSWQVVLRKPFCL